MRSAARSKPPASPAGSRPATWPPGARYAQAIVDAIRGSRAFVLVFSAAANASTQVEREVDRAVACGLPILPLRIEDVVPSESLEYYLAGQHWLDALTIPRDASLRTADRSGARAAGTTPEAPPGSDIPWLQVRRVPRSAAAGDCRAEERKVVTTLICDLVGFTAMSEAADPEDVDACCGATSDGAADRRVPRRRRREVHRRRRGRPSSACPPCTRTTPSAPCAPALRIVEELAGPDPSRRLRRLQVRIGVNTGEALVRLDVHPGSAKAS